MIIIKILSILLITLTFLWGGENKLFRYVGFQKQYDSANDFYQDPYVLKHLKERGDFDLSFNVKKEILSEYKENIDVIQDQNNKILAIAKITREIFKNAQGEKRREKDELISSGEIFRFTTSELSKVGSALLQVFGFKSRIVWLISYGAVDHTFVEVYLGEKRWAYVDFENNVFFLNRKREFCNFFESFYGGDDCQPMRLSRDGLFSQFDFFTNRTRIEKALKQAQHLVVADNKMVFANDRTDKVMALMKCYVGCGFHGYVVSLDQVPFNGGCL